MATILDQLADSTRKRVAEQKKVLSLEEVRAQALAMNPDTGFPFEKALKQEGISFICEVKKASPSKGVIAQEFPYLQIARDYEEAGAAAISVLTEPERFLGSTKYLKEIAAAVKIPVLRKDFTIDEYMIYEAKVLGASAVLLIAAILPAEELKRYLDLAHSLGLSAILEAHDQEEVETAVRVGARIIGVNNRNLKDFVVDLENSVRLRNLVPEDRIFISESGIHTTDDVARVYEAGADAVLVGESLMRSPDKAAMLEELRRKTYGKN